MDIRAVASRPAAWLSAQAILFGAMAAILGVVANAMFLETYGSAWLPVTYIVIGVTGVAISAAIRRGTQRFDLLRLAVAVLAGATVVFAASWVVAKQPDGAWVSGPLLVLFPILIQLGFVFIGGQAGRVLDIAGIKATFPRLMAGFPLGATLGGLVAVQVVETLGHVEDLLLVTAIVQGGFAAVVWATGRRFSHLLIAHPTPAATIASAEPEPGHPELSLRALLRRPLIVLVLAYQVLSALGSQVADFLVFDRASALLPGEEELGLFLAAYTALMNGIAIAFLFLVAGPLLRRYGLRLGIGANPVADLVFALAILVVLVVAGPASVALLGIVSAARITDVALTDGLTRTSINALYQVLPSRQRLAAQATVEGMGVPIAIGVSGVLILLINELPFALLARVIVLAVVCGAWSWVAVRLYREYAPALAAALRTRRLLDLEAPLDATLEDVVALTRLAAGKDRRAARLAQQLAAELQGDVGAVGVVGLRSRAVVAPDADVPALRDALDAVASGTRARPDAVVLAGRVVRATRASTPARDAVLAAHVSTPDRSLGLLIIERLAAGTPAAGAAHAPLEEVIREDIDHAARVLDASLAVAQAPEVDPDGSLARALREELQLLDRRIAAALLARHGRGELGPALTRLARDGGEAALAAEALEVTLGRELAAKVAAVLTPGLTPADRLRGMRADARAGGGARQTSDEAARAGNEAARGWLVDVARDERGLWRSPWLRACAIRAIRLVGLDSAELAAGFATNERLEDPTVAEELALLRKASSAA